VIGEYTIGGATFDALVFRSYEGKNLMYAARTRNGFTPKLRAGFQPPPAGRGIATASVFHASAAM
jgi:hypothetical protein